ncbi:unnamed protein product [Anisakis simplex]|uniref:Pentatricopeptide repeat-containing protein n=1 Tax=Anisakis simplex TaxID=6269 RepID=A0A0M3J017_ANISI|nr:unnamed protein product [Anisakis simplex]
MWRISRACCSRHFLSLNGCLYLTSRRSKSLNAFAEKVLSDSLTFRHRASKLSRGSSLPWFLYDEGGMSVPIFIKRPNNVNSTHVPDITDHFGLLSFSQPSTSGESPYSLDEKVTFIPTVLDDSAEESRLVNSPQAGSEDSSAAIGNDCENMNISKILEQFREEVRDGLSDSGANMYESRILDEEITQRAHRYILPNFRRHKFLRKLLPHRDYVLIRRSKYAKNCRLRSSNHQHVVPRVTERLHASSVVASQSNARNILLSSAEMNSPMSEQASQRASSPNSDQSSAPRSEESEKSEESERNVDQKEAPGHSSVSRIMFDPLEVRVEEISAAQLRKLTKQKDIENLRIMLNEHHWPHFETIKEFISELFEVFIVKGVNCDEVKRLMWDFAATNNRAYVRDVVVVSLLERIVREEGIEAAISYARLNRDMFLVKAR